MISHAEQNSRAVGLPEPDRLQSCLLVLAGVFLAFFSLALTLSPAARVRSWQADYRWDHWLAFFAWVLLFALTHRQSLRYLPGRDPYLLPVAGLLSGWGILTIWRLDPVFGRRQTIWLAVCLGVLNLGLRWLSPRSGSRPGDLDFLRRYKYLWLTAGLLLTSLTLIFGMNPSGGGLPRLWLGCCGVYFQPSEPLKLLLIFYLAAYLAGKHGEIAPGRSLLPLLAPTFIMGGLALLLLLFQRDLGTATIFLFLYALVVYIATGRKRILAAAGLAVFLAGAVGYRLFDVVRLRVDAWLYPWADASGRSYQIVQSLLAVANGGLLGRGPGLGSPSLVPVAQSDFVFVAIAEETGLLGAVGLFTLLAVLAGRGLRAGLAAPDAYRRFLAAGLTTYLVGQSILIVGGNLRLLPLTGVTLPFLSYGGSSLLTSFLTLTLLLQISAARESVPNGEKNFLPPPNPAPKPIYQVAFWLWAGLGAAALVAGWWALYRAPDLLGRTDNARRAIADRYVLRGSLYDRHNRQLTAAIGRPGAYAWHSLYPALSPVIGYTNPIYGQAGLEASLDPYLRGLQGYPGLEIWWNNLVYGQPPPGLDVRLSLDLNLQRVADDLLAGRSGALVLIDAASGDLLVMASHPTFNPNRLETVEAWNELVQDPRAPLFNRAALGQYPPGAALGPYYLAAYIQQAGAGAPLPALPAELAQALIVGGQEARMTCAVEAPAQTGDPSGSWGTALSAGCPAAALELARALAEATNPDLQLRGQDREGETDAGSVLLATFQNLGFYTAPEIRLPTASASPPGGSLAFEQAALGQASLVSPLQMALAAAALSNGGIRPAARLVVAVDTPQAGWVVLPNLSEPAGVFSEAAADGAVQALSGGLPGSGAEAADSPLPVWQSLARGGPALPGQPAVVWYLAGTLPAWNGTPIAMALILEEDDPILAARIGQAVLRAALQTE